MRYISYCGSKIIRSSGSYPTFFYPMFANCVHAKSDFGRNVHVSEREILLIPNCSKFAVEYNWNNEVSQSLQNCFFFGKIDGVFRKKNLNFFQIPKFCQFFVEWVTNGFISFNCLSTLFVRFFWLKIRKFLKVEYLEIMMKKHSILEKKRFFKKASLPKWEGAKYAGGSWPSCFY